MLPDDLKLRSGANLAPRGPQNARPLCRLPQQLRRNASCHISPTVYRCQPVSRLRASPAETALQLLVELSEAPRLPSQSHAAGDDEHNKLQAVPGPRSSNCAEPEVSFVSLVDGKYTVRGRLLLPASASRVYALLTDYAGCHRVFGSIAASEVVRAEDGGGLQVVQSCRWKFLAFSGTFRVHLGVTEDLENGTLLFSLVHSNFMRDFEGRWAVRPADAPAATASSSPSSGSIDWCEVEHQLSVVPSVPMPPPVSYYTRSIFVQQVEGILADLQRAMRVEEAAEVVEARGVVLAAATEPS